MASTCDRQRSDFAALIGPSGSGKSTLLNLIGLLDSPTAGELFLLGEATRGMDDAQAHGAARQRDRLRVPVPSPDARRSPRSRTC